MFVFFFASNILFSGRDPIPFQGDSGAPLLDNNNNILGVNFGFCPEDVDCIEDFADEHRVNGHTVFIDEYKKFIESMTSIWS